MQELKTIKEQAVDHLTVTEGAELDITCNLTSAQQMLIIMEAEAHMMLGSRYIQRFQERMLRLTNSYMGRHRQDIVEIARSSRTEDGQ